MTITWTARLGRIDQFHLRRPIDQDSALIDVGLVGDLAGRQRGRLLKQREGADALAASDTGIVKPEALLEKCDHARVVLGLPSALVACFLAMTGFNQPSTAHD